MGWLAIPAGLAFGLAAALSGVAVKRHPHGSPPRSVGTPLASLVFVVLGVPAMFTAADAVVGGPIVLIATLIGVAGVIGIGIDAAVRLAGPGAPNGLERRTEYLFAIGFLLFHAWIAVVSIAIVASGRLPIGLGWFGLVTIVAFAVGGVLGVRMPEARFGVAKAWFLAAFIPQAGVVVWMVWLGVSL